MKGKLRKPIAFLMALALIFNMGFTAYAGAIPSNYNGKTLVATTGGTGDTGGIGDGGSTTVTDAVYNPGNTGVIIPPGVQKAYEIQYLLKGTKDTVPGLDLVKGSGYVGTTINILFPEVDGYKVLANQILNFVINEDEELNKVEVFYEEAVEDIPWENPDHLDKPTTGITEAQDFYYPTLPKMMRSLMMASSSVAWPNPGAINLTKAAVPVAGSENQWQVTLTIEGMNIQTTSKVVLVIDKSGSMQGSKMTNTRSAAKEFVDKLLLADGATEIAVVSFDQNPHIVSNFAGYAGKEALKTSIDGISAGGGTNIQAGIHQAQLLLDATTADNEAIVLLGDGEPTYSYLVTDASGITLVPGHKRNSDNKVNYDNPEITEVDYESIVGTGQNFRLYYSDYKYKIWCPDHNTYHSTDFPDDNGVATIYEAGLALDKGTDIYSIALSAGDTGEDVLRACQDSGYHELNSSDLSVLSAVFGEIAGDIAYAASNGSVVDPMGTMFDLVSNASQIVVSQGTITSAAGNVISWNVGNIAEGTPATMTYIVQIKAGADANTLYPTNQETTFSYTDAFGASNSENFEIPDVSIGGGSINMKGYLVNELGQPINSEGVAVARPDLAERLYDTTYSNDPLSYNQTYNVTQPGVAGYQYVKYVWNETTGVLHTVPVLLQASAPTQTVWFGYEKVTDINYTVKYFVDGIEQTGWEVNDTVPSGNPEVDSVPNKTPAGYMNDSTNSTPLPFTVTTSNNVISVYYIKDASKWHTVTFLAGAHGTLTGTTSFTDILEGTLFTTAVPSQPTATANFGWTAEGWDNTIPATVETDLVFTQQYTKDASKWHTVTFLAGAHGTLTGTTSFTDILEGSTFTDYVTEPTATANFGWTAEGWDNTIPATVETDLVFTQQYTKDASKWHTVTFLAGAHGSLDPDDQTVFAEILGGTAWSSAVTVPGTEAADGYMFDEWTPVFPGTVTETKTYTANFIVDEEQKLNYTVEYYRDGAAAPFETTGGEVLVADPVVASVSYDNMPAGYKVDGAASTELPFTVYAEEAEVIRVYYVVDEEQQFGYTVNYYLEGSTTPVPGITPNPATGEGYLTESVTEYAPYAEGYSPVEYSKTIALAVSGNIINFYYTANDYNVYYDGGEGEVTGELLDQNNPYVFRETVTVLANGENGFKKPGYHVIGWNKMISESPQYSVAALAGESLPEYVPGDTFPMPTSNVVLVAQWALTDYTLKINYKYADDTEAKPTHTETLNMGGTYSVTSPEITGYTSSQTLVSGTMGTENVEVTVVYTPRTDITYTVNYLRSGTTTAVATAKVVTGQTFGASITENAISVSGYNMSAPTSATITLGVEGNIINFYYTVRTSSRDDDDDKDNDRNDPKVVEIVEEEIPLAAPELNKTDHYQYLQGYPDNTVRPEGNITREEVAAVFYRLLTVDYRGSIMTFDHSFSDVPADKWSTKYIATLANGKILEGNPDGTFEPNEFITKAELAAVASRFDNLSPFEADSFTDIAGHWANKYINSAAQKGWVKGNSDGTFSPDKYITRAEFATLVNNVLERRVHKENILTDARKFPDLLESKWYYEAMQEAINSHYYNRLEDGYEEWTQIYYPELGL